MSDPTPNLKRDDGTLWRASYKDQASAMRALFDSTSPQFFFRRVIPNPSRSWVTPWRPRYVFSGETWEGSDMRRAGFRVIGSDRAV